MCDLCTTVLIGLQQLAVSAWPLLSKVLLISETGMGLSGKMSCLSLHSDGLYCPWLFAYGCLQHEVQLWHTNQYITSSEGKEKTWYP
jgi:hypothetical protein